MADVLQSALLGLAHGQLAVDRSTTSFPNNFYESQNIYVCLLLFFIFIYFLKYLNDHIIYKINFFLYKTILCF